MKSIKKGKYKHYKGNFYEVFGLAVHSETDERLVLYKACYSLPKLEAELGTSPFFVRPYDMFLEQVKVDGMLVDRFQYVGPD